MSNIVEQSRAAVALAKAMGNHGVLAKLLEQCVNHAEKVEAERDAYIRSCEHYESELADLVQAFAPILRYAKTLGWNKPGDDYHGDIERAEKALAAARAAG